MLVAVDSVMWVSWVFEGMANHDCGLKLEALCVAFSLFCGRKKETRPRSRAYFENSLS